MQSGIRTLRRFMMPSDAPLWRSTTVTLVASSPASSADLGPPVKMLQGRSSWTGDPIGVLSGADDDRKSFNDYGPSIYGNIIDTPEFLQDDQIGCKRAHRRGGVTPAGEDFRDRILFNDRELSSAVLAGLSVGPLTAYVDRERRPALPKRPTAHRFAMTLPSCLVLPCANLDGDSPRCECGRIAP